MRVGKLISVSLALAGVGVGASVAGAARKTETATKTWDSPVGGEFGADDNWQSSSPTNTGQPAQGDDAKFDLASAYRVTLAADAVARRLLIGNDKLDLRLYDPAARHTLQLDCDTVPSFAMGLKSGDAARLSLLKGTIDSVSTAIGNAAGSSGSLTLLQGAKLDNSTNLIIGNGGSGNLTVTGGSTVESRGGYVGYNPDSKGSVLLSSTGSNWHISQNLFIGGDPAATAKANKARAKGKKGKDATRVVEGAGEVLVRPGAKLNVDGALNIRDGGKLRLEGGTITAKCFSNHGVFSFVSGTLNVQNSTDAAFCIGATGSMGAAVRLHANQSVLVAQDASLDAQATLILDHGRFIAGQIHNKGEVDLTTADSIFRSSHVYNDGVIAGLGTISATSGAPTIIDNSATGTLRAGDGQSLVINGSVSNSGAIDIQGTGSMQFLAGLVHNGTSFNVAKNATATFAGPVSGAGSFTGGGTLHFQQSYSPGNSPATVSVDGSAIFDPTASLQMELGSEAYDQVNATGPVALADVDVTLDSSYQPRAGDRFTLVTSSSIAYTPGTSVNLPQLGDGLSWQVTQGATALSIQVIPEPTAGLLLAAGGLVHLLSRRRRMAR